MTKRHRQPHRRLAGLAPREHQTLTLDQRTVVLIDEAGMADDQSMLKLLAAVDVAGAKAIVIGDHHQLEPSKPVAASKHLSTGTDQPFTSSTRTSASVIPLR